VQAATDLRIVDHAADWGDAFERLNREWLERKLLCAAVDRFAELGGKLLYLESHSSLTAALTLYESAGFHHEPPPSPSDYERADTYMVYRGR
jgi:hypothetical protein